MANGKGKCNEGEVVDLKHFGPCVIRHVCRSERDAKDKHNKVTGSQYLTVRGQWCVVKKVRDDATTEYFTH